MQLDIKLWVNKMKECCKSLLEATSDKVHKVFCASCSTMWCPCCHKELEEW